VKLLDQARPDRTQVVLAVSCALLYAVGYPLALAGGVAFGWVLVTLGGVVLAALVLVTVRRIDRGASAGSEAPDDRSEATHEGFHAP
jgi:hypothetical protein